MDIRLPMGWFFSIVGILLIAQHWLSPIAGSSVNLVWGLVVLVFGGLMLWLAKHASKAAIPPT